VFAGRQHKPDPLVFTPLTVNVISGASGKSAIASAAQGLLSGAQKSSKYQNHDRRFSTETVEITSILEGTFDAMSIGGNLTIYQVKGVSLLLTL
jgi:hypothetical protein